MNNDREHKSHRTLLKTNLLFSLSVTLALGVFATSAFTPGCAETVPAATMQSINIGKNKTLKIPASPELFFIDKSGKQAVPYTVYEASDFHEGLAAVLIADQWGYIDRTGDIVIGAEFDLAGDFSEGLAPVKVKDKWGYIDRTGSFVIQPRFVGAEPFKNGYAAVQIGKDSPEFPQKANDTLQSILKDPEMPSLKKAWLAIASSRAAGIIDKDGKFLFEPFYTSIQNFTDDLCLAKEGSSVLFLNKKGEVVARPKCDDAKPFSEGLAAIKVGDKWGFTNESGDTVVKPVFDEVEDFHKELCAARLDKKWGFINKKGKWEIQPKFDIVWEGFKTGVAIVGTDISPIENTHADVTRVGGGFLVARKTGRTEDFDESTTPLEIGYFAYPDYRFTFLTLDDKEPIGKQFDHIGSLSDGVRVFRLDGKFGYCDNTGNIFIEPKFKIAEPFSDGLALVKEGESKPRSVERNETLMRQSVPALVSDPDLIRKDIEVCSEVIKKDPDNAQAYRDRGYLLCALSNFKDSLSDFQKVIELCSTSSEGYYWRGMANMQLQRHAEASVDFSNAIETEPSKPQNLMGRALALRAIKSPELALPDINRAIQLQDHPYYRHIRGLIYEDLGQTEEAVSDLQIGRRAPILEPWPVGPKTLEQLYAQAKTAEEKLIAARSEGKNHARIALLAAEQADALDDVRRLKFREEKVLELEELCLKSVELRREALKASEASTTNGAETAMYKSDLANSLSHLAGVYVQNREFDKAAPLYDEAISLSEEIGSPLKQADFLVDVGKMHIAQKDFPKAEEALRRALSYTSNPNDAPSKVVRGQTFNAYALALNQMKRTLDADIAMNNASELLNFGLELAFLPSPPPLSDDASSEKSYELALQCRSIGLIETSRAYMKKALERSINADSNSEANDTHDSARKKAERFLSAYLPKKSVDLLITKAFQKGRTSEMTGDFINAEKFYRICTDAAPDFEWPYEALARLKRAQGDLVQASKYAKKAVSINPNYVEGWLELARIDKEQGDVKKAKQSVKKALTIDPDSQLAQFEQKHL